MNEDKNAWETYVAGSKLAPVSETEERITGPGCFIFLHRISGLSRESVADYLTKLCGLDVRPEDLRIARKRGGAFIMIRPHDVAKLLNWLLAYSEPITLDGGHSYLPRMEFAPLHDHDDWARENNRPTSVNFPPAVEKKD